MEEGRRTRGRRGGTAKPTEKTESAPNTGNSAAVEKTEIVKYQKRVDEYMNEGMNQYSQQFLKKMANSNKIPYTIKQEPLLKQVTKICKLFHMNEMEIAAWSLWLDECGWDKKDLALDTFLLVTAFQTKKIMNSEKEIAIYEWKMAHDDTRFPQIYENWLLSSSGEPGLSVKRINKRYSKYRQPSLSSFPKKSLNTDYNQFVDELFRMKPHRQKEERQHEEDKKEPAPRTEKITRPKPILPTPQEADLPDFPRGAVKRQNSELFPSMEEIKIPSMDRVSAFKPLGPPAEEVEQLNFPPMGAFDSVSRMDFQPRFMRGDSVFSDAHYEEQTLAVYANLFNNLSQLQSQSSPCFSTAQDQHPEEQAKDPKPPFT